MLASLAPKINYLNSLKIKEIFIDIATQIKEGQDVNAKNDWERISEVLLTPLM